MTEAIKRLYKKAGLSPPNPGKEIHKKKFHEIAIAIKKDNPSYDMSRCYSIAMKQTPGGGVKKSHKKR
jgi:hypothetical protein